MEAPDQDVARLDVPVYDVERVQVPDTISDLYARESENIDTFSSLVFGATLTLFSRNLTSLNIITAKWLYIGHNCAHKGKMKDCNCY